MGGKLPRGTQNLGARCRSGQYLCVILRTGAIEIHLPVRRDKLVYPNPVPFINLLMRTSEHGPSDAVIEKRE